ncbi:MAG: metal ABC transporter substrate-binding protein [Mesorhizobium sp.]|uniref:zinc ABC transporter substrate-binding protein AztC n=1 Tax=Mesorhizobium sp. TaxID=1871066 RepID=UPI000FE6DFA3|nr:zinc ABC transporter substrate-binding protein AztC [Mesorhizobium sp.]RWL17526.1 MAG: metal ABC transporter substrate-binding protein [Mesorhizobium sp.]
MSRTLKLAAVVGVITSLPIIPSAAAAENLRVVASFSIIADFAKNVGGDRVDIITLVGPNGDAHVYEPKPADAATVGSADVVLVNGLQFEGFLQRLVEASATKAPVVELTKGGEVLRNTQEGGHHDQDKAAKGEEGHAAEAEEGHEEGHHHHGVSDPHAWQSVQNAELYVKNIADAFCAADAAGCDTYRANAQSYGRQLEGLEAEIKAAVAEIPEDKRTIITSHDAYGYFEHEYGIKFLAPEGVSTESEASASDVAALIKQIRQDKASAIFVENVTNPRLIEQIASETGLKVGGELYSDALSDKNGPAATYLEMMRHNITTIKGAILGS